MKRRSCSTILREIKKVLDDHAELSIRQISIKIKCEWCTVERSLQLMKDLGVVKEKAIYAKRRKTRLFSLNRKL